MVFGHGGADTGPTWLASFEAALVAEGIPWPPRVSRAWKAKEAKAGEPFRSPRRFPTAFIGYRLCNYRPLRDPLRDWQVDTDTTDRLTVAHCNWLNALEPAQTWAQYKLPIADEAAADYLRTTALLTPFSVLVRRYAHDGAEMRAITLSQLGQCITQTVMPHGSWREMLEDQVARLLVEPEATDVALIKNVGASVVGWDALDVQDPVWGLKHRTVRLPLDYDQNRHLWDEYVIDAAGVQLLTGKHLAHAHDLSDWNVEQVAFDRYLVSAKDLEPWYADVVAEPATIEKARSDFGDMILTWDAILANPGPYSVTDSIIVGR